MRYATMEERRRALARLGPSPLATMNERLAAVWETERYAKKLRAPWPPVTGWITDVRSAA